MKSGPSSAHTFENATGARSARMATESAKRLSAVLRSDQIERCGTAGSSPGNAHRTTTANADVPSSDPGVPRNRVRKTSSCRPREDHYVQLGTDQDPNGCYLGPTSTDSAAHRRLSKPPRFKVRRSEEASRERADGTAG